MIKMPPRAGVLSVECNFARESHFSRKPLVAFHQTLILESCKPCLEIPKSQKRVRSLSNSFSKLSQDYPMILGYYPKRGSLLVKLYQLEPINTLNFDLKKVKHPRRGQALSSITLLRNQVKCNFYLERRNPRSHLLASQKKKNVKNS